MVEALRRAQAMEALFKRVVFWETACTRASAWAPQVQAEALLTALADDCLGLCVMEAGARPLVMLASTCRGARRGRSAVITGSACQGCCGPIRRSSRHQTEAKDDV